jgi:AcrR family transcriptional regulator
MARLAPGNAAVRIPLNGYVHGMKTRKYELKQRAERQAGTRQRIVEALVALHREIGPARTTISAVAERAGVERLTVYRHFADETAMFQACSAHFATEVPAPDPATWATIADPAERLRAALLAFYDFWRRGEDMYAHVFRDAPHVPVVAATVAPLEAFLATVRDALAEGWNAPAPARLAAAIGHALRFETWHSLARVEGLDDGATAELMVGLVRVTAEPSNDI